MKRFYQSVNIDYENTFDDGLTREYHGKVFAGVSFRNSAGIRIMCKKEIYYVFGVGKTDLESESKSKVCGTKTNESTEWIPIVGPIKGSYVVKNGQDYEYDYISDFGLQVQDPC